MFALVNGRPTFGSVNSCRTRFLEPLGGKVATLNSKRFSFYSMAETLALPDEGEILLNRRDGFLRFATRYEPKLNYTVTPSDCKGQVNPSPYGGLGGGFAFLTFFLPFLILLQLC